MSGANSFGNRWIVTSFGESHGVALGAVIDGCPAGVPFDESLLRREMERRRPGGKAVSARAEEDRPEILSGVYEGKTLGTPIAIIVRNTDARSADYAGLAPRAGHADDVWREKFGHSDPRGGGRSSGRETVARVIGGAVARMFLKQAAPSVRVQGFATQVGPLKLGATPEQAQARAGEAEAFLIEAKQAGQSYGGAADFWIDGAPAGLGQPVFHKLKAELAGSVMSVGAVCGIEIGDGFEAVGAEGTEFHSAGPSEQGRYGGIRGGISTGERIRLRVAFKPTSSVLDVAKKGRHDPCIVPRAIPVIESMLWLVLADQLIWKLSDRL